MLPNPLPIERLPLHAWGFHELEPLPLLAWGFNEAQPPELGPALGKRQLIDDLNRLLENNGANLDCPDDIVLIKKYFDENEFDLEQKVHWIIKHMDEIKRHPGLLMKVYNLVYADELKEKKSKDRKIEVKNNFHMRNIVDHRDFKEILPFFPENEKYNFLEKFNREKLIKEFKGLNLNEMAVKKIKLDMLGQVNKINLFVKQCFNNDLPNFGKNFALLPSSGLPSKNSKSHQRPPYSPPAAFAFQSDEDVADETSEARLERRCRLLLQEFQACDWPYTDTCETIRQGTQLIEGFSTPERALATYPHLKSVREVAKILLFPQLAEANFARKTRQHTAALVSCGASGTYLLTGRNGVAVGVFKPDNEGIGAPGNPKGISRDPLNKNMGMASTDPFDFSIREQLAYELDGGFAKVPQTKVVSVRLLKKQNTTAQKVKGSFQAYVNDSMQLFQSQATFRENNLTISAIHRIAIQDIRWLNADRHFGNILLDHNDAIFPIDHGLILPPKAKRLVFEWMSLPQSGFPFTEEELDYIEDLNPEEDADMLRSRGFTCEQSIQRMIIATYLLKECARQNFTLREIGNLMISGVEIWNKWDTKSGYYPIGESYFEGSICIPIINDLKDRDRVIADRIQQYKSNIQFVLKMPTASIQVSETAIAQGIRLTCISGRIKVLSSNSLYELMEQNIRILRIAKSRLGKDLEIRPLQTSDFSEDYAMLSLPQLADRSPNLLAAVNGGFFHYQDHGNAGYDWNGFFTKGDPVGALVQNGRIESENPKEKLWGTVAVRDNGEVDILEDEKDISFGGPKYALALGAAPVLIRNGRLNPLERDVSRVGLNFIQKNIAPGDFQRHIHEFHPRTVVALTNDEVLFVTVDGRRPDARGMTGAQLADFLRNLNLGIMHALNLDGGGSTAMWIRNHNGPSGFVNTPADVFPRPLSNILALVSKKN